MKTYNYKITIYYENGLTDLQIHLNEEKRQDMLENYLKN